MQNSSSFHHLVFSLVHHWSLHALITNLTVPVKLSFITSSPNTLKSVKEKPKNPALHFAHDLMQFCGVDVLAKHRPALWLLMSLLLPIWCCFMEVEIRVLTVFAVDRKHFRHVSWKLCCVCTDTCAFLLSKEKDNIQILMVWLHFRFIHPTLEISTYFTLQGQTQHSKATGLQILNPASSVQIFFCSHHVFSVLLALSCSFLFSVSEQSQMFSFTVSSARLSGVHPYVVNQTVCLVCV